MRRKCLTLVYLRNGTMCSSAQNKWSVMWKGPCPLINYFALAQHTEKFGILPNVLSLCSSSVKKSINEVWYKCKDQFFATVESFIPREDKQNFKTCHGSLAPPWFSNDIRRLVRAKNGLFKGAQSSGEPDHWRVYCIARNKASNAVKAAKKKHLSVQAKVLANPNCSSSKWWRVAKEKCGLKGNPCQGIPPVVNSSADLPRPKT